MNRREGALRADEDDLAGEEKVAGPLCTAQEDSGKIIGSRASTRKVLTERSRCLPVEKGIEGGDIFDVRKRAVDVQQGKLAPKLLPDIGISDSADQGGTIRLMESFGMAAVDDPQAVFMGQDVVFFLRKADRREGRLQMESGQKSVASDQIRPIVVSHPYEIPIQKREEQIRPFPGQTADHISGFFQNF